MKAINEGASYRLTVEFASIPTSATWYVWDDYTGTKLSTGSIAAPALTQVVEIPPAASVITDTTEERQERVFVVTAIYGAADKQSVEDYKYYVTNLGGMP